MTEVFLAEGYDQTDSEIFGIFSSRHKAVGEIYRRIMEERDTFGHYSGGYRFDKYQIVRYPIDESTPESYTTEGHDELRERTEIIYDFTETNLKYLLKQAEA
jgi:hypothetical protein